MECRACRDTCRPLSVSQPDSARSTLSAMRLLTSLLTALSLASASVVAQVDDQVPPARVAARTWFRDAKFGMFIHWGVYSQLGQGEWVMENRALPVDTYEWLASAFNPVKFDATAWIALAKAA